MTTTNNATQQDLFSVLPEDERPKEVTPAKTTSTKVAAKPKEEPEPDYYEIDRVVFYAGHKVDVPSREMKLEDVRKWLEEEQFPELTKERCELVYDKDKGTIIPVLKGHRKGAAPPPLTVERVVPEDRRPVFHIVSTDGQLYECRNTQTGYFVAPVKGTINVNQGVKLSVPTAPFDIFQEIVEAFMEHPEAEHLAYVVWDYEEGYSLFWPNQKKTMVSVESEAFLETESRFIVAQIHSHGRLEAFWSNQDNADEIRTGLYGVIGRCDLDTPDMLFRMSVAGTFVSLHPSVLFEGPVEQVVRL